MLPGVYCGGILGFYRWYTATITLCAYVYDRAALPDQAMRELFLRLQMLSTLVHEVAHHKGKLAQGARGRWEILPNNAVENYARQQEARWMRELVAPYLEQAYPNAVRDFGAWMAHYGGVALPLAAFADDTLYGDFTLTSAIEHLAEAVDSGESLKESRLGFAHNLRWADQHEAALQSVARVLTDYPEDVEALALQATTYERMERYEDAERVAHTVLALDATCEEAWDVLLWVRKARGDWRGVEEAASQIMTPDEKLPVWALSDRIRARLELGDFAGAEADIQVLGQQPGRAAHKRHALFSALLLLRQGRCEEALAAAQAFLKNKQHVWDKEVLAVRFEAAHRLGKPGKAGTLTRKDIAFLRTRGYGAWMDRLIADYGAGKKGRR
jgi:tetratricopeptide (TPR) repeat protein